MTRTSRQEIAATLAEVVAELENPDHSAKKRNELVQLSQDLEWELCRVDPHYFIYEHCLTHDEHDNDEPYKTLPKKEYIDILLEHLVAHSRLLVPKSRQVMVTWTVLLFRLWRAMFVEGRLCIIQSDKEEDAQAVLRRAFGVWTRLPDWMKARCPCDASASTLKFPESNSRYEAIPAGEHQVRSRTPSDWDNDESAFQETFRASFIAALPALRGGGVGVCASSAKAGSFFDMVEEDPVEGTFKVLMESWDIKQGVVSWLAPCGWQVLRIHYSCDPEKSLSWAKEASLEYGPLAMEEPDWLAEMEIDPGARAGKLVYQRFSRASHVIGNEITLEECRDNGWPLFVTIDPGYRNPCAILFCALDGDGTWYVVDELYETGTVVKDLAAMMKSKLGRGWPELIRIGHDSRAKTLSGDGLSILDKFREHGIIAAPTYVPVERGIRTVNELLLLLPNGQPSIKVCERCSNTIHEFETYRYREQTEVQSMTRSPDEVPMKRNDHAMDALKNLICETPASYLRRTGRRDGASNVKVRSISQRMRKSRMRVDGGEVGAGFFDEDEN